jgi:hypothetical protein
MKHVNAIRHTHEHVDVYMMLECMLPACSHLCLTDALPTAKASDASRRMNMLILLERRKEGSLELSMLLM